MTWVLVILGAAILGLSIAVWAYRRQGIAAETARDRATADLAAAETAAAQESERQKGAIHASESFGDRYQEAVEQMVAAHPDLAGEYRALIVRLAAGSASAGAASLPIAGAAADAGRCAGGHA